MSRFPPVLPKNQYAEFVGVTIAWVIGYFLFITSGIVTSDNVTLLETASLILVGPILYLCISWVARSAFKLYRAIFHL